MYCKYMSIDLGVASFAISVNCNPNKKDNANKRELLNTFLIFEANYYNCKSSKKLVGSCLQKCWMKINPVFIFIDRSILSCHVELDAHPTGASQLLAEAMYNTLFNCLSARRRHSFGRTVCRLNQAGL